MWRRRCARPAAVDRFRGRNKAASSRRHLRTGRPKPPFLSRYGGAGVLQKPWRNRPCRLPSRRVGRSVRCMRRATFGILPGHSCKALRISCKVHRHSCKALGFSYMLLRSSGIVRGTSGKPCRGVGMPGGAMRVALPEACRRFPCRQLYRSLSDGVSRLSRAAA